jgi:hypothetical protein
MVPAGPEGPCEGRHRSLYTTEPVYTVYNITITATTTEIWWLSNKKQLKLFKRSLVKVVIVV